MMAVKRPYLPRDQYDRNLIEMGEDFNDMADKELEFHIKSADMTNYILSCFDAQRPDMKVIYNALARVIAQVMMIDQTNSPANALSKMLIALRMHVAVLAKEDMRFAQIFDE